MKNEKKEGKRIKEKKRLPDKDKNRMKVEKKTNEMFSKIIETSERCDNCEKIATKGKSDS